MGTEGRCRMISKVRKCNDLLTSTVEGSEVPCTRQGFFLFLAILQPSSGL